MRLITKSPPTSHSMSFKLSVVEQVKSVESTYKQVQGIYDIQCCSTVLTWLRKHVYWYLQNALIIEQCIVITALLFILI